MSTTNLMQRGGEVALAGGVLVVIYDVLDAALFTGELNSEVMTTSSWFFVQILGLVALVLIALGLVGLYACQAKQAGTLGLAAFVTAFIGTVMLFGLLWGEPFLGPMLAKEAPEVIGIEPGGTLVAGFMLTLVLFALGWLLFGLATLRASVLPRGASALMIGGAVLFFILALFELVLMNVVLGAAVAWMGYALWSGIAAEPAPISEAAM